MITFHGTWIDDFSSIGSGQHVDLRDQGLILIRGENTDTTGANNNGAGKSSLPKATTWCLFGRSVDGDKTQEVINTRAGEKAKAVVRTEFDDGTHRYRVQRTCLQSGRKLKLERKSVGESDSEYEVQDGATMADTQASIEKIIGMDFDTWRNTVLFGQGDVRRFGDRDTTDAERKSILKRVMGLGVLDDAAERAKKLKADAKTTIEALESTISSLSGFQTESKSRLDKHRVDSEGFAAKQAIRVGDLTSDANDLKDEASALESDQGKLPDIEDVIETAQAAYDVAGGGGDTTDVDNQISDLETDADAIRSAQADAKPSAATRDAENLEHDKQNELGELRTKLSGLEKESRETSQTRKHIVSVRDEKQKRVEGIKSQGVCPTCGNPADSDHTRAAIADLEQEVTDADNTISDCDALISALDDQIGKMTGNQDRIEGERSVAVRAVSDLREQERAEFVTKAAANADALRTARAELSEIQDQARRDLESAMKDLEQAQRLKTALLNDLERAKDKRAEAKRIGDQIDHIRSEVNPYNQLATEEGKRLKQLSKDSDAAKAEMKDAAGRMAVYEFWRRGFGNAGLPSMIMDGIMPVLTDRANRYLRTLSDGDITIKFETETETKGGENRDRLSIIANIEGSGNVTPSGGQHKRIALAVDLALMDVIAERENSPIDILFLDEVLDGLDDAGRRNVMKVLQELRTRRSSIFVITQDDDLTSWFENSILVKKEGGISTISAVM